METNTKVFRREELAQVLKISQRKCDELILAKEIKSFKVGKRRLISESAVTAYIKKQELLAR